MLIAYVKAINSHHIFSTFLTGSNDYNSANFSITFVPDLINRQRSLCLNLSIVKDGVVEDTESFLVSIATLDTSVDIEQANSTIDILDSSSKKICLKQLLQSIELFVPFSSSCLRITYFLKLYGK